MYFYFSQKKWPFFVRGFRKRPLKPCFEHKTAILAKESLDFFARIFALRDSKCPVSPSSVIVDLTVSQGIVWPEIQECSTFFL